MKRPLTLFNLAVADITLAAISFIDLINDYMQLLAAIAATVTLLFAIIKFIRDEKDRKQKRRLLEEQIKNEIIKRKLNE